MRWQEGVALPRCVLLGIILGCSGATEATPPNAVSVVIQNATPDSAFAVLKHDSAGPVLLRQSMQPGDSICWTTVVVDSIYLNIGVWVANTLYYAFARSGGEGGFTISRQAVEITHKWRIIVFPSNPRTASVSGLIGSGCP